MGSVLVLRRFFALRSDPPGKPADRQGLRGVGSEGRPWYEWRRTSPRHLSAPFRPHIQSGWVTSRRRRPSPTPGLTAHIPLPPPGAAPGGVLPPPAGAGASPPPGQPGMPPGAAGAPGVPPPLSGTPPAPAAHLRQRSQCRMRHRLLCRFLRRLNSWQGNPPPPGAAHDPCIEDKNPLLGRCSRALWCPKRRVDGCFTRNQARLIPETCLPKPIQRAFRSD